MKKFFLLSLVALLATSLFAVEGALPGQFAVSYGKVINFSQGNLEYCAATNTWRFAPRQYGVVGADGNGNVAHPTIEGAKSDNLEVSETYDGWIDLFCWGTSGWNSGAAAYQPWATVNDGEAYVPTQIKEESPRPDNYDLVGSYANADWGVYNKISNGGNEAGLWWTLTREDWRIITEDRPNAEDKIGKATIAGARGMVLLPDNWVAPAGVTWESGWGQDWGTNSYSYAEWKPLEDAGAVFLPCAGQRWTNWGNLQVDNINSCGYYWTSQSFLGGGLSWAYDLYFSDWIHEMYTYDMRQYGESVRLVCNASGSGIEDIHVNAAQPTKVMHNGNVYIFRGEKIYTVTGQVVK